MIEKKSLQNTKHDRPKKISEDAVFDAKKSMRRSSVSLNPSALLSFLLTGALLTLLYVIIGFYPFGTNSVIISDLSVQYAPDLVAYKNQILSGNIHTYSFLFGMGKNVFGLLAYYLASPVNLIMLLFPSAMISESILVLITIKLSLAAAFMTIFLRGRFHTNSRFAVLFGIIYATCSYAMVYMINIMWLDGFLLLPLLLHFVEQYLVDRKYWWRITITLLVLFVSGFYIAYMVGIFSFLYLLSRLYEDHAFDKKSNLADGILEENQDHRTAKTKTAKTVFGFIGSAVLAAGMSAAILLPAGMDILGNADHSAKSFALDANFKFISFLNQIFAGSFDSLSNNMPLVYCGLTVLLLSMLFFLNPIFSRRKKILAGGTILFFVICFNLSFLDLAWQLFDSPNWFLYRYSFLLVFVILMISFASLLHIQSVKPRSFVIAGAVFLVLLLVVQSAGDLTKEGDRFYINLLLGGLELLCLYAISGVSFPSQIANLKKLIPALLVTIICIEMIGVNPLYMRPKMYGGEMKREPLAESISNSEALVQKANEDATGFFRMEIVSGLDNALDPLSAGLYLNYRSISTFNSSSNKDLNRALKNLGYDSNYNYFALSHSYSSVVTDSLLGIRYVLFNKENQGGYELVSKSADGKTFLEKNSSALPIMYLTEANAGSFDYYAIEKNTTDKNLFAFQDELLVSLFGDKAFSKPVYYNADVSSAVIYNAIVKEAEPKSVSSSEGSKTDSVTVKADGSPVSDTTDSSSESKSISILDTDLLGSEPAGQKLKYGTTYLRMSSKDVLSLTYTISITSKDPLFVSFPAVARNDEADVYVNGARTAELSSSSFSEILSLGSFEPGDTVTVSVRADVDTYSILQPHFCYCNTALFQSELAAAVQDKDVQIKSAEDGYVSAQITAPKDQLLLTTIPYEKGWTLLVDGVKTEITPYQDAFISVPVTAGSHSVVLTFTPPGMWVGAAVAGVSLLAFAGAVITTYGLRRKSK